MPSSPRYAGRTCTPWTPCSRPASYSSPRCAGKGTNRVGTNGVTAIFMFLTEGPFGYSLSPNYLYFPKRARAYLFPNLSKFITCAAAKIVLTPFVRCQGAQRHRRPGAPALRGGAALRRRAGDRPQQACDRSHGVAAGERCSPTE